jgi:predicted transposase YbfD/YdcC
MHQPETTLVQYFGDLEDFRLDRNKKHLLVDIIVLAICCTICGANGFVEIETVAKAKLDWFRTFLPLPNGIPSHDTFGRIFRRLRPNVLEERFLAWVQATFADRPAQQIAVDGKQSRRTADPTSDMPALQMISAWAVESGVVLGQLAVDAQSNEITALPLLLETLDVEGCDITADAIHCQKETVKTIIDHNADYTIAVKANQGHLYADIVATFAQLRDNADQSVQKYMACEKDHGRIETRQYWVTDRLDNLRSADAWQGLQTIGMVESERVINGKVEQETRYYISSREPNAHDFGTRVRGQWSIENSLHWVLDVVLREDESRIRKDHSAENMAVMRHIVINLLKQEKTLKVGTQAKRLRAACDNDYLGKVIRLDVGNAQKTTVKVQH